MGKNYQSLIDYYHSVDLSEYTLSYKELSLAIFHTICAKEDIVVIDISPINPTETWTFPFVLSIHYSGVLDKDVSISFNNNVLYSDTFRDCTNNFCNGLELTKYSSLNQIEVVSKAICCFLSMAHKIAIKEFNK